MVKPIIIALSAIWHHTVITNLRSFEQGMHLQPGVVVVAPFVQMGAQYPVCLYCYIYSTGPQAQLKSLPLHCSQKFYTLLSLISM